MDEETKPVHKGHMKISDVNDKVDALAESVKQQLTQLSANIMAALAPGQRQPVVQTNQWSDSGELAEPFSEGEARFDSDEMGPEAPKLIKPVLYDVNTPEGRYMADIAAFMEQMVTIEILPTHDPDAAEVFEIANNGKRYLFRYGETYTVPRYIVHDMGRAQVVRYRNEEYVAEDGRRAVKYPAKRGLRYQFAVKNDTPRGQRWLKTLLTER